MTRRARSKEADHCWPRGYRRIKAGDHVGHLYRIYDAWGDLIYVGSTISCVQRIQLHLDSSPFADCIHMVIYETCWNIDTARAREKAAIETEQPRLNRQWNPDFAGLSKAAADALYEERLAETPETDGEPYIYTLEESESFRRVTDAPAA